MLLRVTTATVTVCTQTGYLDHAAYEITVAAALGFGLVILALLAVIDRYPRASA